MKPCNEISVAVIDHGQFVEIANRMAQDCAEVFYCSPYERGFPVLCEGIVGDGFDFVTRIKSWCAVVDQCDLFVFPDVGFVAEQKYLRSIGKAVWGSGIGGELETNRGLFLRTLEKVGLPVPDYEIVKGMTALRLYLKDKQDKYVKISAWRGDMETFHWLSWEQNEVDLDRLSIKFGPCKDQIRFFVFDPIDAEIEDGIDSYCMDGQFPNMALHAVENKDKSLIGVMQDWDDLPEETRMVNEAFAPVLRDYGYRGAFSTEVRITKDGESFFIDPTCRFPSPPFQLMLDMFGNFSEIIWHTANGQLINPEPAAKCGVQAALKMEKTKDDWSRATIPDEIKPQVKGCYHCEIDGDLVFPPSPMAGCVAWLTATGDTVDEAIKNLQEYKKQLPDCFSCEDKSLTDLLISMESADKKGIEFDAAIPEPETVLEET